MRTFFLVLLVALLLPLGWYANAAYWAKGDAKTLATFSIPQGASARDVGAELARSRVISSELAFRLYLKLHAGATRFQPGTYTLPVHGSIEAAITEVTKPVMQKEKTLRIIEGWSLYEIGAEIERLGIGTKDEFFALTGYPATDYRTRSVRPVRATSTHDWKEEFPILLDKPDYVSLEGYLFPDTYRFASDATPEDVVRRLLREFTEKFSPELATAAEKQGKSVFEAVTMASILEREVRGEVDRRMVSDLLWRRLAEGWPLQVDSSVNYVTRKGDPSITYADRDLDSPYNTYKYKGLPLGPISNPGLDSLQAALEPKKNPYWFFLTTKTGEVKYGRTIEEHAANRRFMR